MWSLVGPVRQFEQDVSVAWLIGVAPAGEVLAAQVVPNLVEVRVPRLRRSGVEQIEPKAAHGSIMVIDRVLVLS